MNALLSCRFNMDSGCVELLYDDAALIAIDCTAAENELADNVFQRSELDWLIYNKPMEYAQLVLDSGVKEYLKGVPEHRLSD